MSKTEQDRITTRIELIDLKATGILSRFEAVMRDTEVALSAAAMRDKADRMDELMAEFKELMAQRTAMEKELSDATRCSVPKNHELQMKRPMLKCN